MCANDQMAIGALRELQRAGVAGPGGRGGDRVRRRLPEPGHRPAADHGQPAVPRPRRPRDAAPAGQDRRPGRCRPETERAADSSSSSGPAAAARRGTPHERARGLTGEPGRRQRRAQDTWTALAGRGPGGRGKEAAEKAAAARGGGGCWSLALGPAAATRGGRRRGDAGVRHHGPGAARPDGRRRSATAFSGAAGTGADSQLDLRHRARSTTAAAAPPTGAPVRWSATPARPPTCPRTAAAT